MMFFWFYVGKDTVNQCVMYKHKTKLWHQFLVSNGRNKIESFKQCLILCAFISFTCDYTSSVAEIMIYLYFLHSKLKCESVLQIYVYLDRNGASCELNVRSWLSSHSKNGNPSKFVKNESGSCRNEYSSVNKCFSINKSELSINSVINLVLDKNSSMI